MKRDRQKSAARKKEDGGGWREGVWGVDGCGRVGGKTGGLKVLGRKRDKDGKEGSSEGGISTQRQIERDYFECQCCTLSAQA